MRTNLDLLRAFAVMAVFIDHILLYGMNRTYSNPDALTALRLGRAGVLIFFVHTFYVLLHSLNRDGKISRSLQAMRFYVRRIFRIYPMVWFIIAVVCLVRIPLEPELTYVFAGYKGVLTNGLLLQNVFHISSVMGPLWSLPYEVQMYAVLPLLFWLLKSAWAWLGMVLCYGGSVMLVLFGAKHGLHGTFLLEYVPCFLAGGIAFLLEKKAVRILSAWVWPIGILVAGAAFLAIPFAGADLYRISSWALCLVIGTLLPFCADARLPLVVTTANWVAKYSYGIYIVHVPVIWAVFSMKPVAYYVLKTSVCLALTLLISWLLFHLLEAPCIQAGKKLASRIRGTFSQDRVEACAD